MKNLLCITLALPLFALSCASPSQQVEATDNMAWQDGGDMGMDAELMAQMVKFGTPGKAHKAMEARTGKWNVSSTIMMAPGADEMGMASVSNSKMILGGRYYVEETSGEMMGMPFEGQLTMGFNNITEEWWTIWMDSMSTGFATCSGKADQDGVINMKGTMVDGMTPEGRPYRSVTKLTDDKDKFVVTMFDTLPDGTEWSVMEMAYTRAKDE